MVHPIPQLAKLHEFTAEDAKALTEQYEPPVHKLSREFLLRVLGEIKTAAMAGEHRVKVKKSVYRGMHQVNLDWVVDALRNKGFAANAEDEHIVAEW